MDSAKIKNYILIVLLLLNACLAALVLLRFTDSRASARAMEQSTLEILAQKGIAVTGPVDLLAKPGASVPVSRDAAQERDCASRLLSGASGSDQGGGSIMYTGKSGQAVFRGTGEFELLMTDSSVRLGRSPSATGARLMRRLGMSGSASNARVSQDDSSATVVLQAEYEGRPILNCEVTFTFTGSRLLLAVGRRPLHVAGTGSDAAVDASTALMRALALLTRDGQTCTELQGLSPCYVLDCDAAGDGTLTPVWRIETDVRTILISAVTGEPVAI